MADVVLILTTVPEDFVMSGLAQTLVRDGHAACVSVLPPMESTYQWKGGVETTRERQVLIKTTADRVAAVEATITAAHPYDVPELLVLPVAGGGASYLAWIAGG
jgi:periplasmic divalent cation tolerance protein